ncbi:hypothetical protein ACFYVL_07525 [Streptomyces sp. NPDC004111]|uniref:hypothetical protein n=1 Tax=Streptomyces sp. NPDC004111 TaxID=3364690 RepID=UPI003674F76C
MTTTTDGTTGEQLAESLLQNVGSENMRAATRLLGAHHNGYWLRRFLREEGGALAQEAGHPVIDRGEDGPSLDWEAVGFLLLARPPALGGSRNELAVLECAASLVTRCAVHLGEVIRAVDETELQLILRAIKEAASGKPR